MEYMLQNGSFDLYTPFLALESAAETMVCAPGRAIQAIAGLHPLYLKILRLCRDGELPRERMQTCLLYTSPSPRDLSTSRMPSSA